MTSIPSRIQEIHSLQKYCTARIKRRKCMKKLFAISQAEKKASDSVKVGVFCPSSSVMYKCNSCCIQKPIKFFLQQVQMYPKQIAKKNICDCLYLSNINFAIIIVIIGFQKTLFQFRQHTVRNHLQDTTKNSYFMYHRPVSDLLPQVRIPKR